MSVMSRAEQMQAILRNLVGSDPDLEGAAVVTADGLPLSAVLPPGTDEDRVAAMGAAALSMGSRTASELRRGELEQVLVKGDQGYVILMQAGSETVLQVISSSDARLGLLLFEMKAAAKQLAKQFG
ncbi:MAG: roadblock/LC7 domain-containing protein [Arachnia sp.]